VSPQDAENRKISKPVTPAGSQEKGNTKLPLTEAQKLKEFNKRSDRVNKELNQLQYNKDTSPRQDAIAANKAATDKRITEEALGRAPQSGSPIELPNVTAPSIGNVFEQEAFEEDLSATPFTSDVGGNFSQTPPLTRIAENARNLVSEGASEGSRNYAFAKGDLESDIAARIAKDKLEWEQSLWDEGIRKGSAIQAQEEAEAARVAQEALEASNISRDDERIKTPEGRKLQFEEVKRRMLQQHGGELPFSLKDLIDKMTENRLSSRTGLK
jgi:hypothetical protein